MKNPLSKTALWLVDMDDQAARKSVFVSIWKAYYKRLAVFVSTFPLPGYIDEDDVVQEILYKVYAKLSSYSPRYSLSTWIYAIARNCCIDVVKRKRVMVACVDDTFWDSHRVSAGIVGSETSPEASVEQQELKRYIAGFIEGLEQADKRITFLRFYEGLSYRDISTIVHVPVGTAKYRVHEIKNKLKRYLEEIYGKGEVLG
jgi:RNA polymerase sigma-70 factor (ECF subfamily)